MRRPNAHHSLGAGLGAAGLVALFAPAHGAEVRPWTLSWRAPTGCPPAAEVEARIDRLLGPAASSVRAARLVATVTAVGRAEAVRYLVELEVASPEPGEEAAGSRVFEGETCAASAEATALVAAMMIDPDAAAADVDRAAARQRPAPVAHGTDAGSRPNLELGLRLLGDGGRLPSPSVGVGFVVGAGYEHLEGELGLAAFAAREAALDPALGTGGRFALLAGSAALCTRSAARSRGALRLCAGLEANRVSGRAFGVSTSKRASEVLLAPFAGVGFVWAPGRRALRLRVDGQGALSLSRPVYTIAELGPVFRPAAFLWRIALGTGWVF